MESSEEIHPPIVPMAPERVREVRLRVVVSLTFVFLLLFPFIFDNDATTDSVANSLTFVALALGLNIVVGFAGLLDLGYAAFFAIGAYWYGIFSSFQVLPLWHDWWGPIAAIGLVEKINQGGPDLV